MQPLVDHKKMWDDIAIGTRAASLELVLGGGGGGGGYYNIGGTCQN